MNYYSIKIFLLLILSIFAYTNNLNAEKMYNDKGIYYGDRNPDKTITIISPADAPKSESAAQIKANQNESGFYEGGVKPSTDKSNTDGSTNNNSTAQDDATGVDKAVYDNAIADGKSPTEASAAAGGYTPSNATTRSVNKDTSTDNLLGISNDDLRNGNVNMNTIPKVIINIINILLGIAGTISILSLIYYAFQMQINSGITGDSSGVDKAKKGMIGSIIGFVIAICAWFIIIKAIEILTSLGGS